MTNITSAQRIPAHDNLATSFEAGIITTQDVWVGVCIKFAMYDHSMKLTHWPSVQFNDLRRALQEYCDFLGANAFMLRAHADPSLVSNLPERHPYHTLLAEQPSLTQTEVGASSPETRIDKVKFVARGPTFELRVVYGSGQAETIMLHEYTALSLLPYLEQYLAAAKVLIGPAAGSA